MKVSLKTGVLIQKRLRSIVSCISTYNNSLKLSTHAIVIIFIIQEIVSRNQVGFTFSFFLKKTKLKKSKTANLKIEKNQNRTIIKLTLELNRTKDKTGPTHKGIDQKTATQP